MLAIAMIELFLLGAAVGWFGHMFHVWHKHKWHDSKARKLYMKMRGIDAS